MAVDRYLAVLENSAVNSLNYQELGFEVNPSPGGITVPEMAARIIGYLAQCTTCATGTTITAIKVRLAGAPGFTTVPYPAGNYTVVDGDAVTDGFTTQPGTGAYPFALGAGALCPLGTSISVTENTATAGPTGRGRHFLPFVSATVVASGGQLAPAYRTAILNAYREFFLATKPGGGAASGTLANPVPVVVTNAAGTPLHAITGITPQPVFSNLESRRR